ncbi:MAG: hypothetical protein Q8Q09_26290 [Deltaproteobacteria bacterium]|nr:hypothetical protein [Deltaproteobacteria bacterium]
MMETRGGRRRAAMELGLLLGVAGLSVGANCQPPPDPTWTADGGLLGSAPLVAQRELRYLRYGSATRAANGRVIAAREGSQNAHASGPAGT